MTVKLSDLVPAFRATVEKLLAVCAEQNVRMVPTFTLRTPAEQALFWRQSRSIFEINKAIDMLRSEGANYLADILEGVGPHNGPHVTNALPGNSWHQWAEAIDCMWEVDGKFIDSDTKKVDGVNGYRFYAETAKGMRLDPGFFWTSFKDSGHVQMRGDANPKASGYSWRQIDQAMRLRFGSPATSHAQSFSADVAMATSEPVKLSYAAPEGWRVYETTDKPAAVFRSPLAIDADGAPNAYHQDSSRALDYLANAGRPGNWWALEVDGNGEPVVQGASDPAPGYYISKTSLENPGFDRADPRRYIDAATIPYVVLPGNRYRQFTQVSNIRLGDLAAAYNIKTAKMSFAIFADTGPHTKLGEGSIALAENLGLVGNPKAGGTEARSIIVAVFPGSGAGRGLSSSEIAARIQPHFDAWGGLARLKSYQDI
ncbi:glycoside hydrolase family 75 protein [Rhizobium ruizarguesonis]